ncbi:MAG: hypothetical protein IPL74_13860 [Bacteroidetes bacterium]|nr:hypothetical protein [Bacteroidota bacterium]
MYDKYLFFYYNSLVINYSKLDKEKAIQVLEDIHENRKITATPFYEILFIQIFLFYISIWLNTGNQSGYDTSHQRKL